LDYCIKDEVERRSLGPKLALHQDVDWMGGLFGRSRQTVGSREGDKDLAAAVVADGARTPEADIDPSRQPSKLARVQWDIRCHDRNARALLMTTRHEVGNLTTDGLAGNEELMAAAVVGLEKNTDGESLARQLDDARRRPDAAFEIEELSAGSRADAALADVAILSTVECGVDVFSSDAEGSAVAQEAVVCFGDDRNHDVLI